MDPVDITCAMLDGEVIHPLSQPCKPVRLRFRRGTYKGLVLKALRANRTHIWLEDGDYMVPWPREILEYYAD